MKKVGKLKPLKPGTFVEVIAEYGYDDNPGREPIYHNKYIGVVTNSNGWGDPHVTLIDCSDCRRKGGDPSSLVKHKYNDFGKKLACSISEVKVVKLN